MATDKIGAPLHSKGLRTKEIISLALRDEWDFELRSMIDEPLGHCGKELSFLGGNKNQKTEIDSRHRMIEYLKAGLQGMVFMHEPMPRMNTAESQTRSNLQQSRSCRRRRGALRFL